MFLLHRCRKLLQGCQFGSSILFWLGPFHLYYLKLGIPFLLVTRVASPWISMIVSFIEMLIFLFWDLLWFPSNESMSLYSSSIWDSVSLLFCKCLLFKSLPVWNSFSVDSAGASCSPFTQIFLSIYITDHFHLMVCTVCFLVIIPDLQVLFFIYYFPLLVFLLHLCFLPPFVWISKFTRIVMYLMVYPPTPFYWSVPPGLP